MKAIDRAKAHFEALEERKIAIPEWGEDGQPLEVFCKALTLQEKAKLYRMAQDNDLLLFAYAIIYKALDGDGQKLFSLEDKKALIEKADADVVSRLGAFILTGADVEDQEKN
jgi:hypothetical protein